MQRTPEQYKKIANLVINDYAALKEKHKLKSLFDFPKCQNSLDLYLMGHITKSNHIFVIEELLKSKNLNKDDLDVLIENGFFHESELEYNIVIQEFLAKNMEKVEEYKTNPKLFGWFVGQIMKQMGKGSNAKLINKKLKDNL